MLLAVMVKKKSFECEVGGLLYTTGETSWLLANQTMHGAFRFLFPYRCSEVIVRHGYPDVVIVLQHTVQHRIYIGGGSCSYRINIATCASSTSS